MDDCRAPTVLDGSRVNVVLPPLALDGPALTIRRFRRHGLSPEDLVANGTLGRPLLDFLARAVRARASVLVCGGTGSGKTTTLNVLSSFVGADERVVTIEDAAELRLRQPHVVRLEARPPNLEGRGEVTIRRLVRNALRMRPDRIIVGEVRGPEALDLLTALSTGHDGSLSTVHAGSPTEALRRIEVLALMSDVGLPHAAIREQIADAFDLVVCQARTADGSRRIVSVAEVVRVAAGPAARELYAWRGGAPRWGAALTDELAACLEAAGAPHGEARRWAPPRGVHEAAGGAGDEPRRLAGRDDGSPDDDGPGGDEPPRPTSIAYTPHACSTDHSRGWRADGPPTAFGGVTPIGDASQPRPSWRTDGPPTAPGGVTAIGDASPLRLSPRDGGSPAAPGDASPARPTWRADGPPGPPGAA